VGRSHCGMGRIGMSAITRGLKALGVEFAVDFLLRKTFITQRGFANSPRQGGPWLLFPLAQESRCKLSDGLDNVSQGSRYYGRLPFQSSAL